jgi:hypothetical protein
MCEKKFSYIILKILKLIGDFVDYFVDNPISKYNIK